MQSRNMFQKNHIDSLFGELNKVHKGAPDSERLHRDAHLAIAYFDAGREIPSSVDDRVLVLIDKYRPNNNKYFYQSK